MSYNGFNQSADCDAIRDLLTCYALMLDADDIDSCLELFTEDGEFVVHGKTVVGRGRIGRRFTRAPNGMHLMGASLIDVQGATATARLQVLFIEASTHDMRPALYDDDMDNADGQWLFRRRRCQFITGAGLADAPQEPTP